MADQYPSEPDAERNPFDDYVNNHLDFDGFEGESGVRFTPPSPEWDRAEASARSFLDDGRASADPEAPVRFTPRLPFGTRGALPFPSLDDARWRRGSFEVVKDLRIHKTPTFALSGVSSGANVMVFPNAYRYANKRLRYIPDIFPGWSAVHVLWEKPVLGYVNHNEVRLMPHALRLHEHWSDILLIIGMCLLLLVIGNIALSQNGRTGESIGALEAEVATLQGRIEALEMLLTPAP